jgi:hypothetical protein
MVRSSMPYFSAAFTSVVKRASTSTAAASSLLKVLAITV